MDRLTKTLLGGAALSALIAAPAVAGHAPNFHVQALHAGKRVNKTKMHSQTTGHVTYTISAYTSVPASDLRQSVPLTVTFYKWNAYSGYSCSNSDLQPAKDKLKVQKKSMYGKVRAATETYSFHCVYGPTAFYGDAYELKDTSGFGQTDHFRSTLYGKFRTSDRRKYKGTLNLNVSVTIGTE